MNLVPCDAATLRAVIDKYRQVGNIGRASLMIAERIVQLGGEPDFAPATLTSRSHADYDESLDLQAMIRANLIAERVAIEAYGQMIKLIGDKDSTTRRMLESILSQEQEHADDMRDLLAN